MPIKEIKGTPASPGKIVARAFVYDETREDLKIPDEDFILVCISTYPEMMDIIIKSKGIITKVGGLLSHPAIVSRELGIPCVLNINIDEIYDGDLIEIDGNTGVVRILKKILLTN